MEGGTGEGEVIWVSWERGNRVERGVAGGVSSRRRPRAVFSGGRLLQLRRYYKAGLLRFMNKAMK